MNKLLHFIFLSITLFLIVPSILLAQGGNPEPTPIDEGLLALSFFGVAFAVYRFMKKEKSKK